MGISPYPPYFILTAVLIWSTYLLGLVIYRLFFHPLAKFPGPKYAALSRWHEFYYEVVKKGQFTFVIQEYHKKYGPIVRIVPDEIHIQDPRFYDTLYTKAGRVDKYAWMANRFNSDQSVFATPAADLHLKRRGALNPLFSRARILSFETVVGDKVNLLMNRIRTYQESGKPFSLSAAFMALAGDVIMQYCFALNYDHLNSEDFKSTFHEPFMAVSISGHLSLQFPLVPKILFAMPESWLTRTEPLFALMFRLQKDFREQIVALREGKNEEVAKSSQPTVFQELLENPNLPPDQKETRRLQDEAQLVVAAGITTVGWALSVGAFHIINEPAIFTRLRRELEEAIPDPGSAPNWTELEKLPYLTGCIREAIRLSYPVTSRNPRLLSKPLAYKDWVIPSRTPISMTIIDINNDEDIFPQHEKFKPERWINPPPTKDGSSLERYFVCFQKGSRSCLGINLAYAELYLALAAVFRTFTFELYQTDESDVRLAHDFFLPSPKLDSKGVRVKCAADSFSSPSPSSSSPPPPSSS